MVARMWMRAFSRSRCTLFLALALAMLFDAVPAAAQDDYGDPSGKTLTVTADLRLIAANGERSWTDGGFGKTRFGPSRDRFQIDARAIKGDVVWQPHLSWSLDATIAATVQQGADNPGLSEAICRSAANRMAISAPTSAPACSGRRSRSNIRGRNGR
jgi:hypothetical protein